MANPDYDIAPKGKIPANFARPLFASDKKGPLFPQEKVGSAMSEQRRSELHSKSRKVKHQAVDFEFHYQQEVEREKARMKKKLMQAGIMLAAVYLVAIAVFHFVEGWTWEDSIYFTTSTITTVGYGDLVPHSYVGRLFTIPLMLIGIGVGFYVIYTIQDYGRYHMDNVGRHVDRLRRNGKK